MYRKPTSHLGPCCLDFPKTLDPCDIRFPASRSFVSYLIAREAIQICVSRTFVVSGGHSAFPDQRMAPFSSGLQCAENPLLYPSGAKGAHFAGIFGGLLTIICRIKETKDCLVDQVESEPFSTAEFRQQTQFEYKLVQSPIADHADRMCQ